MRQMLYYFSMINLHLNDPKMKELEKLEKMLQKADPATNPNWKTDLEMQLLIAKLAVGNEIQHLNSMIELWKKV